MRRSLGSVTMSGLLAAAVIVVLSACSRSFDDPASAQCGAPPVTLDQPVDKGSHQEVVVHFACEARSSPARSTCLTATAATPPPCGFWGVNKPTA
jgi:hypothetical protein